MSTREAHAIETAVNEELARRAKAAGEEFYAAQMALVRSEHRLTELEKQIEREERLFD